MATSSADSLGEMAKTRKFGPFLIDKRVGSGGMGIVYKAVYEKTGQTVALKVLSPEASSDEKARKRFDREMEILKRLEHRNIVKYFGGGRVGNQDFFAMELMDGGALDERLSKKGPLNWEQTVEVGKGVARALEHAHHHGIIHRDLKPANLFLSKGGLLKLGDFGIARDSQRTALTAAGKTVGTYAYMAPEQITGQGHITGKTDQYALGCVLFELVTGKPPFEADNAAQMLMQHLEIKPPLARTLAPECPVWLEGVINKLLEKEPEDRYYDALAVYNALKDVTTKVATGASVARQTMQGDATLATMHPDLKKILRKKKKKKRTRDVPFYERAWFLAACLVLLIAVVTWLVWPMSDEERFQRGKSRMEEAAQLAFDDGDRSTMLAEAKEYFDDLNPDGPHAEAVAEFMVEINADVLRRQVEVRMRTSRSPRTTPGGAESLYMQGRKEEDRNHRLTALKTYERMKRLLKGNDEVRPYLRLVEWRMEQIYKQEPRGEARELIDKKLKAAEELVAKGLSVKARLIWNDIIGAYGDDEELKPLVDRARAKVDGKKK